MGLVFIQEIIKLWGSSGDRALKVVHANSRVYSQDGATHLY